MENGIRVTKYVIVGEVMLRSFENCDNPYWNPEAKEAWTNIVSAVIKLLIRAGLKVEAELSPEELANAGSRILHGDETDLEHRVTDGNVSKIDQARELTDSESSVGSNSPSSTVQYQIAIPNRVPDPELIVYEDACWDG